MADGRTDRQTDDDKTFTNVLVALGSRLHNWLFVFVFGNNENPLMFIKYKKLLLWEGYHILIYLYSLLNHFSVGKILQNNFVYCLDVYEGS